MAKKTHYKLYKRGKLWCSALIAVAILSTALIAGQQTAKADTNTASPQQVQLFNQSAPLQSPAVSPERQANNTSITGDTTNAAYLDNCQLTIDPATGQASLQASGWQVNGQSNQQPYRYAILFDNTTNSEINRQQIVAQARPDVQQVYPAVPNSANTGFNVKIPLSNDLAGHTVSLIARYSDDATGEGHHTDYWFAPFKIDGTNVASLDGIVNDQEGTLTVSGWHASNLALGRKYHYIIAFDSSQGHEIARQQVVPVQRPDAAAVYPAIANAGNAGFSVQFQLSPEYSRDNIQFISRWTDDPAGNGDAVDYWFNPLAKINRGNLDSWNLSDGSVTVSGWHANDATAYQPYHYLILFDNTTGQQVTSGLVPTVESPDVAVAFSDTKTANRARFNYNFGAQAQLLPNHTYALISRYSAVKQGNGDDGNPADYTDFWYPLLTLNRSAYWIDSYCFKAGNQLRLTGWFANDAAVDKPFAYVIVLANGQEIARQKVDLRSRPDVAAAYPQIFQSKQSGFETVIQLPKDQTTGDLQLVLRFSNDQQTGEGQYADIWTTPIKNGMMTNRLVQEGDRFYYYDGQGRPDDHFISDGVLYRTDGNGNVQNKFAPDNVQIGTISFAGDLAGISKDNKKVVQVNITLTDQTKLTAWATIKWQGNSSLAWPKKGYRVKLFKDAGLTEKLKVKLPGSGFKTNSFNLKACFTDPTAGLNVVNAQLFSEITATRPGLADSIVEKMPNYGQIAGVPLELGINGLDQGLYVLETYQEDKLYDLNDKKTDNIALSDQQSNLSHFTQPFTLENLQEAEFEAKSPAKVDQSVADRFNELYRLATADEADYAQLEAQYLDVPAAIDYLVFSTAINNIDGVTKNATYISKQGSKWVIMPYDLDASWNNNWDGGAIPIDNNYEDWLRGNQLFLRIYQHHRQEIVNRYRELRQTVLGTDHVTAAFNQWFNQVSAAAYQNNSQLWADFSQHPLLIDPAAFAQVIEQRLTAVDQQLGI